MNRPAWFVAALLLMLALVISAQLVALGFGVQLCLRQAEVVFEHQRLSARDKNLGPLDPQPGVKGCQQVQQDFKEAVERNGSLVLALLGGGGLAAAAAGATPRDR